jgi:hypothetical protein
MVLLLLLEGGLYLAFAVRERLLLPVAADSGMDERAAADGYHGASWTEDFFREFEESNVTQWHSYVYWRRAPYQGEYIQIDGQGLRRTWNPAFDEGGPKRDFLEIFFFGGSAVWGTGARDDHTIPSCLSRILNEGGVPVRVTNFGESGYVSTQELIALVLELRRGHVPDLAIFYDGVNDTFSALQNGTAGIPQNEEHRRREFNLLREGGDIEADLAELMRGTSLYKFSEGLGRRIAGTGRPVGELSAARRALAGDVAARYSANLRLIRILGKRWSFRTLFYWQPAVFLKEHRTPYEERVREQASKIESFYLEVRRRIAASVELRAERDFHDLSLLFEDEKPPLFIDWSHVTEAGNAHIARRIATDI